MADQTEDKTVIHYPWVGSLVTGLAGSILGFFLFYYSFKNVMIASIMSALFLIRYSAEKFRKLEITENDIAYWPPLCRSRRARFADITSIKKANVSRWFGSSFPSFVSGAELQLPNYEVLQIPLDLPNSDEVYDKIVKAWESQRAAR